MLGQALNHCQIVVGHLTVATDPTTVLSETRLLIDSIPSTLSERERLLLGGILARVLGTLVLRLGIERHPALARAFVDTAASSRSIAEWRACLQHLVDRCALSADLDAHKAHSESTRLVSLATQRALRFIDVHYADNGLALTHVASEIRRSAGYTGRLLMRETGVGFVAHVRIRRVRAAQELLRDPSWTLKEIAQTVGFGDASSFSRAFKQVCGRSPALFRMSDPSA